MTVYKIGNITGFAVSQFKIGFAQVSEKGRLRSEVTRNTLTKNKVREPKQNHKPSCTRRTRRHVRQKRRARLEVARNFFLVLKEIRFHQHAESQLISNNTKTAAPPKTGVVVSFTETLGPYSAAAHKNPPSSQIPKYIYIYIYCAQHIYIYIQT